MTELPPLDGRIWIADGGLETTIVYLHGIVLPSFAAFPLLDHAAGREELARYYTPYLREARRRDLPMVLDTPTWRASGDWATDLGWSAAALARLNAASVGFVCKLAQEQQVEVVLNGAIGPRGDGYVVGAAMSAEEAAAYHAAQIRALVDGGAELVTAVTMTYAAEAIGVVRAARDASVPVAVSFTVETDGRLPSGQPLGEAIALVDAETDQAPAYFMINCAHPSHFEDVVGAGGAEIERVRGIRANASRASHAELDRATALDRGDPQELAEDYRRLRAALPNLAVVGGCCGTDHEHIAAIAAAVC